MCRKIFNDYKSNYYDSELSVSFDIIVSVVDVEREKFSLGQFGHVTSNLTVYKWRPPSFEEDLTSLSFTTLYKRDINWSLQ